jgi:hypothetical protein
MSLKERLRQMDGVSVSKEFRVYTMHGAVLSVATLLMILYLVISEVYFNFQVILKETVHVNATSPAGLEMEFDITLPKISCSKLHIDANDQQGQSQSLHLDRQHHVWKHRIKMKGERKIFIGRKERLELGSTLKEEQDLVTALDEEGKVGGEEVETKDADDGDGAGGCGSCYGAGDEGECCDTCEDVRRAYKRKGWVLRDVSEIKQCQREATASPNDQDGEGCNVHGVVALSTGGGNLHLAPGKGAAEGGVTILDALIQSFQEWNVSHTIHKIRFGAEHPSAVYQLDDATRTIADSYGMYQYYLQVSRLAVAINTMAAGSQLRSHFRLALFNTLACSDAVPLSERYNYSNISVQCDRALATRQSGFEQRTSWSLVLLRSEPTARGDQRRIPERMDCFLYKRQCNCWRCCNGYGNGGSVFVFQQTAQDGTSAI